MNNPAKTVLAVLATGVLAALMAWLMHRYEVGRPPEAYLADKLSRELREARARVAQLEAQARQAPPAQPAGPSADIAARLAGARREIEELKQELARLRQEPGKALKPGPRSSRPPAKQAKAAEIPAAEVRAQLVSLLKKGGLQAIQGEPYKELLAWARRNPQQALAQFAPLVVDMQQPATVRAGAALVFDKLMGGVPLKEAVPQLEQAAGADPDPIVRRSAVHALAFMAADEALPALEKALQRADEEWGVKLNAAYGLAARNRDDGVQYLLRMVDDPQSDATMRAGAAQSLFMTKPKKALPYFYRSLTHAEMGFRMAAASGIGSAAEPGDQQALTALRAAIERQGETDLVLRAAKQAYNKLAGEAVYRLD